MAHKLSIRWFTHRLRQLRPGQVMLLAEAGAWLVAARLALLLLPVRHVIAWKQRPVRVRARQTEVEEQIRQVAWAVSAVARRSPIKFVCFPQTLAAHAMLAGRGIESRLHYGALRDGQQLKTHTWLEAGGRVIVGGEEAAGFATLAVY